MKQVLHSFYSDGKIVYRSEWYEAFSKEQLEKKCESLKKEGYGNIQAVADSTGRLVTFNSNE